MNIELQKKIIEDSYERKIEADPSFTKLHKSDWVDSVLKRYVKSAENVRKSSKLIEKKLGKDWRFK